MTSGYGGGGWGESPWGSGGEELALLRAFPVRENVARLEFNVAPLLTFLSDPRDGSEPARYGFAPVAGTSGRDGLETRPVRPFSVARAAVPLSLGRFLDVTVDRSFSPYAARYLVSVNGLLSFDGLPLLAGSTSAEMDGLRRGLVANVPEMATARGDFAAPVRGSPGAAPEVPADASGDAGTDQGLASYRKRVLRRLTTRRGAFSHLPGYGVGAVEQVKQLARASVRGSIAAEAEAQVRGEPETLDARARIVPIVEKPGAWRVVLRVRTAEGAFEVGAVLEP